MNKNVFNLIVVTALALNILKCGLPSNEFVEDLNTPKLLTATRSAGGIEVSFIAYNPESNFSGYNIYISKDSEYAIENALNNHINYDNSVNTDVEHSSIVKNQSSSNMPTIQDSDSYVIQARGTPTKITYAFDKIPGGTVTSVTYYIAVTAYSTLSHTESGLSEIITTP